MTKEMSFEALARAVKKRVYWRNHLGLRRAVASWSNKDTERIVRNCVDPCSPSLAWLIEHAGTLVNLCHRGAPYDTFTAQERLKGKSRRTEFRPSGELVEFQWKTGYELERRWQPGVFLVIVMESTERIAKTAEGVYPKYPFCISADEGVLFRH